MLAKESVKTRLSSETGLSYTEFTYMLLQAFDFVHLMRTHDCRLQVGGADQWGNITAGIDLARRMYGEPLYGLVCPLLVKTDGGKMGKTERGAVWLDPRRTSPYQFYQYWLNVADDDAGMCLRFMTELSHDEIAALDQSRAAEPEARASQRTLADELTRLIHGADGLERARMASEILFGAEIQSMTDEELMQIFADVPHHVVPRERLDGQGYPLVDALVEAGLVKSKGEARRVIGEGGAYLNNRRCDDSSRMLGRNDLASTSIIVLRRGKKNYALVTLDSV
jgi:tyrosyl-tRNA synthetase